MRDIIKDLISAPDAATVPFLAETLSEKAMRLGRDGGRADSDTVTMSQI